jgi:hypothetical protein
VQAHLNKGGRNWAITRWGNIHVRVHTMRGETDVFVEEEALGGV